AALRAAPKRVASQVRPNTEIRARKAPDPADCHKTSANAQPAIAPPGVTPLRNVAAPANATVAGMAKRDRRRTMSHAASLVVHSCATKAATTASASATATASAVAEVGRRFVAECSVAGVTEVRSQSSILWLPGAGCGAS